MKTRRFTLVASVVLVTSLILPGSIGAKTTKEGGSTSSPDVEKVYKTLNSNPNVQKAMKFIKSDEENTLKEQIEMTEIPAPPYHEQEKAEYFKGKLDSLGLKDVHTDKTGNVIGTLQGSGDGPTLAVDAHLDIAFPEGTDTTVKEKDGKLYAPGIGDDTRGLAALLSVIRAYNEEHIKPVGDIIFIGTVGEEDDFRGVDNYLKAHHDDIDAYISVDGSGETTIKHGGTAGSTVKFNYHAQGGHAWGNNDRPSATHALGRAVAEIANFGKDDPKTTFNVGTIEGGTRENAKAEEASMLTEFRTDGPNADEMKQKLVDAAKDGAKKENERWNKTGEEGVTVDVETKIDIPGGKAPKDSIIVQAASSSVNAIDKKPNYTASGMTNSNYAHGYDLPAINLGAGGKGGNAHSLDEWFDPTDAYLGPQQIFMTLLGLNGMDGESDPLLGEQGSEEDTQKPDLTIESPKNNLKTNHETVTVKGTANDENLDWVKVNNKKVNVDKDGSFSKRMMLEEGKNKIKVVAKDEAGNKAKEKVTVKAKFNAPAIKSLKPEENLDLKTGDSVKIEMDSEPDLHPTFEIRMPLANFGKKSIQNCIQSLGLNEFPMMETSKGHYIGYWTVPSGIKAKGAEAKVMITDDFGNKTQKEAKGKLNINIDGN